MDVPNLGRLDLMQCGQNLSCLINLTSCHDLKELLLSELGVHKIWPSPKSPSNSFENWAEFAICIVPKGGKSCRRVVFVSGWGSKLQKICRH